MTPGRKLLKFAWLLFFLSIFSYCLLLGSLYFNQSAYLFHPKKEWDATPKKIGLDFEDVSFTASDGTQLSGWFVPASKPRGTILFVHGNSRNISYELGAIKLFHGLGFSIFLFDYRGFGHSEGNLSPEGVVLDAEAALGVLTEQKKIPMKNIIILGRSFGGAIAIPLAVRHTPCALMVDASFASLAEMAQSRYPYVPIKPLLQYHFESVAEMPKLKCPVLVTHSIDDQIIPYEQGRRLFEAAPFPKRFLQITGPHDNRDDKASQALYDRGVTYFFDTLEAKT